MLKLQKVKPKRILRFILLIILTALLVYGVYLKVKPTTKEVPNKVSDNVKTISIPYQTILLSSKPLSSPPKIQSEHELIDSYVDEICSVYEIDPYLIKSVICHESSYNPNARNGSCIGLMQISRRWHKDRMRRLEVDDLYDPYGNILIGVDYISELKHRYKDMRLVLMLYNMRHQDAIDLYSDGIISKYAKSVLKKAEDYKNGG